MRASVSTRIRSRPATVNRRPDPAHGGDDRHRRRRLRLEQLEARWVPTTVTEFPVPTANSQPSAIITVGDNLWFLESASGSHTIAKSDTSGNITEYNILTYTPWGGPDALTLGPDGNLWLVEWDTSNPYDDNRWIAKVSTGGMLLAEYQMGDEPSAITSGPDGRLWIAIGMEQDLSAAVVVMNTDGSIAATVPTTWIPQALTTGPDGMVWFTSTPYGVGDYAGQVGKIDPDTLAVTEYNMWPPYLTMGGDITTGSDGNLWFMASDMSTWTLGQATTGGSLSFYPHGAYDIPAVPDGNLWLADADEVVVVSPSSPSDSVQVIDLGTYAGADCITAGPNGSGQSWQGDVWVTERGDNEVVRIDTLDSGGGGMMPAAMPAQNSGPSANGTAVESANSLITLSAADIAPGTATTLPSAPSPQLNTAASRSTDTDVPGTDLRLSNIAAMFTSPAFNGTELAQHRTLIHTRDVKNDAFGWWADQDTDFDLIAV